MNRPKISVVIPSRNGLHLLLLYLPKIIDEVSKANGELLLVDDCSTDKTVEKISALFPSVKILARTGEPGFCYAVNLGMNHATSKYRMLLNNDIIPSDNSFVHLVKELDNAESNVAVVVPKIIRPDKTDDSLFGWKFKFGLALTVEIMENTKTTDISKKIYPSGACSLWREEAWCALSGLTTDYAPIYWEDADLGFRMNKAGFSMKRCTNILVKHEHASTMGSSLRSETLRERNRFIFMFINCNSFKERVSTYFWLPFHLFIAIVKANKPFINGYKEFRRWKRYGQKS